MRGVIVALVSAGLLVGALPAVAQNTTPEEGDGTGEVIVTGSRIRSRGDVQIVPSPTPAAVQMLRRTADFAIQQAVVMSDTLDEDAAKKEVLAMVRKAVDLASGAGVQIASGDVVVEAVTAVNYGDLKVLDSDDNNDDDDDSDIDGQYVKVLVKVPLTSGIDPKAALAKLDRFIRGVSAVGRAEMKPFGALTLSVVNPEQYRGAIVDLVARDTVAIGARFGAGYGVEVIGLDRPVLWKRAGLTELQLYLPVTSTIRPRN